MRWERSGLPVTSIGKYLSAPASGQDPDALPDYMQHLLKLWNCQLPDRAVNGFGSQSPVFVNSMPSGFTLRLGRMASDIFYSGTFEAGGYKIGFIRIPSFSPSSTTAALTAFQKEIDFFEKNTDGLIVDVMRDPGGSVFYLNQILSKVIPFTWRSIAFEVRATSQWVASFSSSLEQIKPQRGPQSIIDLYEALKYQL